jgi:hypothetical protein
MISSRKMRWVEHCSMHESNAYEILVLKSEGKGSLGRHIRMPGYKDNIKVVVKVIDYEGVGMIIWLRIETSGGHL